MKSSRWLSVKSLALVMLFGCALVPSASAQGLSRVTAQVNLHGAPAIATHVRQALPGHLMRALAEHPIAGYPQGSRLVVRIESVFLASGSSGFGGFGGIAMPDSMEGHVDVVDTRGRVLFSRPLTAHHPVTGNVHTAPLHEPLRVNNVMKSFAYWAVRRAGP